MTAYLASMLVFAGINALLALGLNVVGAWAVWSISASPAFLPSALTPRRWLSLRLGWPMLLAVSRCDRDCRGAGGVAGGGDSAAQRRLPRPRDIGLRAGDTARRGERAMADQRHGRGQRRARPVALCCWRRCSSTFLCMALCWGLVAVCYAALTRLASSHVRPSAARDTGRRDGRGGRRLKNACCGSRCHAPLRWGPARVGPGGRHLCALQRRYVARDALWDVLLTLNVVLALTLG